MSVPAALFTPAPPAVPEFRWHHRYGWAVRVPGSPVGAWIHLDLTDEHPGGWADDRVITPALGWEEVDPAGLPVPELAAGDAPLCSSSCSHRTAGDRFLAVAATLEDEGLIAHAQALQHVAQLADRNDALGQRLAAVLDDELHP
jgi:hypothetical protein